MVLYKVGYNTGVLGSMCVISYVAELSSFICKIQISVIRASLNHFLHLNAFTFSLLQHHLVQCCSIT